MATRTCAKCVTKLEDSVKGTICPKCELIQSDWLDFENHEYALEELAVVPLGLLASVYSQHTAAQRSWGPVRCNGCWGIRFRRRRVPGHFMRSCYLQVRMEVTDSR